MSEPTGDARWWVYVLVSVGDKRTYVGVTTDLQRRLRQHNGELTGGARSTRAGRPWRIGTTYGPYPTRSSALKAEAQVKALGGMKRLHWSADPALVDEPLRRS